MRKLLALLLPILFISACAEEVATIEEPIKAVKTITISESSKANSRQISGTVESSNESQLSFRVGGRIEGINVKTGDSVTKSQTLATLGQKEYQLAVQTELAKRASARSDLTEKSDALKRQKHLKKKGFVPQASVEEAQAAYNAAKSALNVAQTALNLAQNDLSNTTLKAPFDGIIATRDIEPFTEVSAGQTAFTLQSEEALEVSVLIPETLIRDVSHGDAVTVNFPTVKNKTVGGVVSEISAQAESGNAFPVKVLLAEAPVAIRAGMTAKVTFNYGERNDTSIYLIPVSALDIRVPIKRDEAIQKPEAPVLIVKNGVVEQRMVTIRDIRGNEFEVTKGLETGDILIIAGVPFLNVGQKVKQWKPTYNLPATIQQ